MIWYNDVVLMERRPYYPESSPQDEKLTAALRLLEQGVEQYLTSEGFAAFLEATARFHHYSYNNVLLILAQRPEASRVASFRTWQQLGRSVNRGEKGIAIVVPHLRNIWEEDAETGERVPHEVLTGFGIGHVFDVAQTSGKPLPEAPHAQRIESATEAGRFICRHMAGYLNENNVPVRREALAHLNGALGYYDARKHEVVVGQDMADDQAAAVLVHEAVHAVHGVRKILVGQEHAETVAESTAFVVLHHFGLDTARFSFPYVAGWAQDKDLLTQNLSAIQQTAHAMISGIEQQAAREGYGTRRTT